MGSPLRQNVRCGSWARWFGAGAGLRNGLLVAETRRGVLGGYGPHRGSKRGGNSSWTPNTSCVLVSFRASSFRSVKIRYTDMDEHQGQSSLKNPTDIPDDVYPLLSRLLTRLWDRRVRLRMVHVKLSNVYSGYRQYDLFGERERRRKLALTCEAIREKFGQSGLMRAHDLALERL